MLNKLRTKLTDLTEIGTKNSKGRAALFDSLHTKVRADFEVTYLEKPSDKQHGKEQVAAYFKACVAATTLQQTATTKPLREAALAGFASLMLAVVNRNITLDLEDRLSILEGISRGDDVILWRNGTHDAHVLACFVITCAYDVLVTGEEAYYVETLMKSWTSTVLTEESPTLVVDIMVALFGEPWEKLCYGKLSRELSTADIAEILSMRPPFVDRITPVRNKTVARNDGLPPADFSN